MEITPRETFEKLLRQPVFRGKIVTDSMEPLIKVGDQIVVDVGADKLKRFDIIVVLLNGVLTCHYLWVKNEHFTPILLQTRSLKYNAKDFPIELSDYLGRVVSHKLSWCQKLRIVASEIFR